jgi:predicted nucleic acid-binding Zn ribbon protein
VPTDLTLIKGILAKALAGKGIDKKIERYEFVLHWDKIVGEKLAEVSKPDYISRKTLIVRVLHPVWAQEFTFMKGSLLRKLAPYLQRGDVVDDMIFRVGPLEE